MSVELINVTEWHSSILCFYTCAGVRKTVSADLIAYSALEQPVLEPVPWMEEGASHNLTCKVPAVAPARNLTVTLGRGAETLRAGTFEHDADLSPHQVQVTQRITARRRHHGQNVTCQAELSLEPHGPRLSSAAAPAALAVYAFPEDPELNVTTHLEVNETANATCTIRTFFPEARFALSLDGQPLPASVSEEGHRAVAELALPRPGAFEVLCTGSVGPQERQARATVHVHSECRGARPEPGGAGYPEPAPLPSRPGVASRPAAAMPRRGRLALPLATMLLALFGRAAPGAAGSSFAVVVAGPETVPYGEAALVNCSTTCPAAEAAGGLETSLAKGSLEQGPGWLAVRLHNVTEPRARLLCYFTCFGQRKTAALTLMAYRFPDPYLAISEPNASLHEPVAVECSTAPSQPPGLQLWLRSSRGAQVSGTEGHVLLNLTAHEEDDGLEFVCEAELPVGNQTLQKKSAPAKLSVFYGPRMDEAGCPQQQTWTEGREAALRCSARGNPPPHVECARDGRPFPVAQPQPAARAHAGTYRCRAANRLGDAGRTVEVLVEYYEFPVLPAVLVTMAVLAFACAAGVGYGFYHHKKKIRRYKLQERQRQMEMQPMVGRSPEAAAPNGSAPAAGP
nr:intercellular adhesion molecule 1-like [Dromaius novaehollandiae]